MLHSSELDPRPLRIRILEALPIAPAPGISMRELGERLGDPPYSVSSVVSKMHAYGGPVEKIGEFGPSVRWRRKT